MSPQTLYDEILSQARNHNPSASSSEILEGVFEIISREILPTVFKALELPQFPSWSMLAIESRGRRRRKSVETPIKLVERRAVIQKVDRLKRQISWDGGNSVRYDPHFSDSNNITFLPTSHLSSAEEAFPREFDYGEEIKTQSLEEPDRPYLNDLLPLEPKEPMVLSEEIQRKIVSEPVVEEVFKRIEVRMRNLATDRKLEMSFEVSFHSDAEIPSWKKYVIKINPPSNLDFKARMNIRTLLDMAIRKEIDDLLKSANGNRKEYLNQLSKSLFLHIEL